MKFIIKHEIKGRVRIHFLSGEMTYRQADILQYYLMTNDNVESATVYNRTNDVAISYNCDRKVIVDLLRSFSYGCLLYTSDAADD